MANLEKVREIVLDFRDARSVGQGFADEVFRVFANHHPGIVLWPENPSPAIMAMIRLVSRGATGSPSAGTGSGMRQLQLPGDERSILSFTAPSFDGVITLKGS